MIRKKINKSTLKFLSSFEKGLQNAPDEIKQAFIEALEPFSEEPNHPHLRNHALKENYSGYRSININEDWRAIFRESRIKNHKTYTFHLLGTHKKLYD